MKDYKEKYENALSWARSAINAGANGLLKEDLQYIFPELKESEDERIRKALIHVISEQDGFLTAIDGVSVKDIIAWLEKQDPKKHEEELENAYKCADEVQYRKGYEDAKREFEKQVEQKPTEWSYNDNLIIEKIILALKAFVIYSCGPKPNKTIDDLIEYLKSLKERYTWKPSEEQMAILWDTIGNLKHDNYEFVSVIYELYNDLKKLREK